ncbi:MAG TPA: GNAT family N-acetyltransferase [Alphaproteobacteria bacterium]|nr:GNAT family N-acetyltransferase [Alphaproteobacteria bacterium]HNS43858.1 GNAT family N-acetyltransferase [Alphaproteobacteria bacterium]
MNRTIHLTSEYIEKAYQLMTFVRNHLPEDEKHFLRTKSLTDLFGHHARGDLMLGVETPSGQLIGLLIAQPTGIPAITPAFNFGTGTTLVQSVCIHPDHTGSGQVRALFDHLEDWAKHHQGVTHLHAKVSTQNVKSLVVFAKLGFSVIHRGHDPERNYEAIILEKQVPPLAQTALFPSNTGHDFAPAAAGC